MLNYSHSRDSVYYVCAFPGMEYVRPVEHDRISFSIGCNCHMNEKFPHPSKLATLFLGVEVSVIIEGGLLVTVLDLVGCR